MAKKESLIRVEGNKVHVDKLVDELIKSRKEVLKALAYK